MENYSNMGGAATPPSIPRHLENEMALSGYLSSVMRKVYGKMFLGLLVTAFVALGVVSSPALVSAIFSSKIVYFGLMIAELAVVVVLSARINTLSTTTATALFYLYAVLNGVTMSMIFLVYTASSIATTFFITAGVFGAMSIYGYVTKANLNKLGSFLFMGLLGLIVATLVNVFMKSSTADLVISIIGVLLFVGITAWDTQKIKQWALETDEDNAGKLATFGALSLYLDFINIFLYLLRFFGRNN